MTSSEIQAAADRIRASAHPAAHQIADLLADTARNLTTRENLWTLCGYTPTRQNELANSIWGREIAIAQALTTDEVMT